MDTVRVVIGEYWVELALNKIVDAALHDTKRGQVYLEGLVDGDGAISPQHVLLLPIHRESRPILSTITLGKQIDADCSRFGTVRISARIVLRECAKEALQHVPNGPCCDLCRIGRTISII